MYNVCQLYQTRQEQVIGESRGQKLVVVNQVIAMILLGHSAVNMYVPSSLFAGFSFMLMQYYKLKIAKLNADKITEVWITEDLKRVFLRFLGCETIEEVEIRSFFPK